MEKITLKEFIENLNKEEELNESKILRFFLSKKLNKIIKKMETRAAKNKDFKFKKEIAIAKKLQKEFNNFEEKIKNKSISKKEAKREVKILSIKIKSFLKEGKKSGLLKGHKKIIFFFVLTFIFYINTLIYNLFGVIAGATIGISVTEEFPEFKHEFKEIHRDRNNFIDSQKNLWTLFQKIDKKQPRSRFFDPPMTP